MPAKFNTGLVELISPHTVIGLNDSGPTKIFRQVSQRGIGSLIASNKSHVRNIDSRVMLANNRLLELSIKSCKEKLYITFSEDLPESFIRTTVPELYNTIWDMCIHWGKMDLSCVILMPGINRLRTKFDILENFDVDVVMNVGKKYDSKVIGPEDLPNKSTEYLCFEDKIAHTLDESPIILYDNPSDKLPQHECVALGGTFDNLHNGHRNLLSVALAVCTKRLIIGLTGPSLLKGKSKANLIEPFEARKENVEAFMKVMTNSKRLTYEIHALNDKFGPTTREASLGAIIVSSETLAGAREINLERKRKKFRPLDIVVVMRSNIHTLSSTFIRDNRSESMST